MASGFFPIDGRDHAGQELMRAAQLVTNVLDYYTDDVYCGAGGQFDNAASDGGAIARLALAVKLIQDEVREFKVDFFIKEKSPSAHQPTLEKENDSAGAD